MFFERDGTTEIDQNFTEIKSIALFKNFRNIWDK